MLVASDLSYEQQQQKTELLLRDPKSSFHFK